MKKNFKSKIISFISGAIIFGSIGTALAYVVVSSAVDYTPLDVTWKNSDGSDIENAKMALDDLYKRASKYDFEVLYHSAPGTPENFSYTFNENTKNVLVILSSIRDAYLNESDSTITFPNEAVTLYDLNTAESYAGRTGYVHARAYYLKEVQGTISGRISYRGSIKIFKINRFNI